MSDTKRNIEYPLEGKWSYSTNEENYAGECDTREEAIAELFAENPDSDHGWIGRCVPFRAEWYIHADDVIEQITCQDECSIDAAQGWPHTTKEELQDLTDSLRAAFCAWMDRTDNRPNFYTIDDVERVERESTP